MAAATAVQPNNGFMAKISNKNTNDTGASMQAIKTGVFRKSRSVRKSFMGWMVPPGERFRLASKMAVKTRELRRWSSATEASCISWPRAQSSTSITTKAPTTNSVSIHNVMWLRLVTTRSYTSSM